MVETNRDILELERGIFKMLEDMKPKKAPETSAWGAAGRGARSGATFGWDDELFGSIEAAFDPEREYKEVRDEYRRLKKLSSEEHGAAYMAGEIGGTIATSIVPGMGAAKMGAAISRGVASPLLRGASQLAALSAEGAVTASIEGAGRAEEIGDVPGEMIKSGLIGGVTAPVAGVVMKGAGHLVKGLVKKVARKVGPTAGDHIEAEIGRIARAAGLEPDEVARRIEAGEIMGEMTETTRAISRTIADKGGEALETLSTAARSRVDPARRAAQRRLSGALAPDYDPDANLLRQVNAGTKAAKEREDLLYAAAYGGRETLDAADEDVLGGLLAKNKDLASSADDLYARKTGIDTPLYAPDNPGANAQGFTRSVTMQDAERLRRRADRVASKFFKETDGDIGDEVGEVEKLIREMVDRTSPDMKDARAYAAKWRAHRDAFEAGRGAFKTGAVADEVGLAMDDIAASQHPDAFQSFRLGSMASLRARLDKPGAATTLIRNLQRDGGERSVLGMVVPENEIDDVLSTLSRAENAARFDGMINSQSMTNRLQQQTADIGAESHLANLAELASGSPTAGMRIVSKALGEMKAGDMTPEQRAQVAKLLIAEGSEGAALLRDALTSDAAYQKLVQALDFVAQRLGYGVTMGAGATTRAVTGL